MENSPTLLEKILPKARVGIFWFGIVLWVIGCGLGITTRYDAGVWFLLIGMGFMHTSDVGRPVIINLFNSVTNENQHNNNSGYL